MVGDAGEAPSEPLGHQRHCGGDTRDALARESILQCQALELEELLLFHLATASPPPQQLWQTNVSGAAPSAAARVHPISLWTRKALTGRSLDLAQESIQAVAIREALP